MFVHVHDVSEGCGWTWTRFSGSVDCRPDLKELNFENLCPRRRHSRCEEGICKFNLMFCLVTKFGRKTTHLGRGSFQGVYCRAVLSGPRQITFDNSWEISLCWYCGIALLLVVCTNECPSLCSYAMLLLTP